MIDPDKKILFFPVEIISRELDYRIILAAHCLQQGCQVFIGNHTDIYNLGLAVHGGLYVGKNLINVSPSRTHNCYDSFKAAGHGVVYHDEEGAFFQGNEDTWKDRLLGRINPEWLKDTDVLCTWGRFQADVYRQHAPKFRGAIVAAGHGRFQLGKPPWRGLYQQEADQLREKFGNYWLLNTNFKYCNHGISPDFYLRRAGTRKTTSIHFYEQMFRHQQQILDHFLKLVPEMRRAFPGMNVVIRPHPSENDAPYRTLCENNPGVFHTREGSLMGHLLASRCLVHNGCTTSIECDLAGLPVVTFLPCADPALDYPLPNTVGIPCRTEAEVLEALAGIHTAWKPASPAPDLVRCLADAEPGFDSFRSLTGIIHQQLGPMGLPRIQHSLASLDWRRRRENFKALVRRCLPRALHWTHKQNPYIRTKFPGFKEKELRERVALASGLAGRPLQMDYIHSKMIRLTVSG